MSRVIATWGALALVAAGGCAAQRGVPGATLHADHPLVGRTWAVRQARFVDAAERDAALAAADLVMLGETHDNPEHHLLQARILRALVAAGRRPAVVFEMLDTSQQPRVDAALASAPRDPDALADAVAWARSGWPAFAMYRPVFAAALDAGLPVVAANLSRAQARQVVEGHPESLPPKVKAMLDRQPRLDAEALAALREEMSESHCGELPASMLDPMVEMQRARDAQIAERVVASADDRGAVLVAGAGHARDDRGVPAFLRQEAPARSVRSVAFLEVSPDLTSPDSYAAGFAVKALPFDYVVFTPRAERGDPCEGLRKRKHAPPVPADSIWVRR